MKTIFTKIFPFIILFSFFTLVSVVYYWGIDKVYFQQDEWFKTGKSIYYLYADFGKLWTNKFAFHYYPLLNLIFICEYLLFKLHVSYYLYLGVFLQAAAALLFYILTKRLFEKRMLAFILSFLFLINPGIHQVMLNEMVSLYKVALIIIFSLFIYLHSNIQKGKELKTGILLLLLIFYIASTFIFESMLVLIVLMPAFYFLFKSKKTFVKLNKANSAIFVSAVVLTILRLLLQSKLPVDAPLPIQGSLFVTTFYNAATTPYKFLVEYIFSLPVILFFADIYSQKIFSFLHEPGINLSLITITTGYEIIVNFFTGVIVFITAVFLVLFHSKTNTYKRIVRILIFSVLWLVLNATVIAPQGRIFTSIESRYLYIAGVGVLWIIGSLLLLVWDTYKSNVFVKAGIICIVFLYLFTWSIYSYYLINREKQSIIKVSVKREKVINQIKSLYPVLPSTAVFYVYCSDDCTSNQLYGMPKEWVVPFQNGLGWTLLTVYSTDNPRRYAPFFSDYLFWDSKSAGYRQIGRTAFGFFTDFKALKKAMRENALIPSDIIVLSYKSKEYRLTPAKNKNKILFPDSY